MKKEFIRKDDVAVSPVIAVILMVAITVVLAGVLYVWVNTFNTPTNRNISISSGVMEKTQYWEIEIISVSGGSLSLEDAKFQIVDTSEIVIFKVDISKANPASINKGLSIVYPIPSGSSPVIDNSTGTAVTENSDLKDYNNCLISYNDQDADGKVSAGDNIWIYKENDSDGTDDVKTNYEFEITLGDEHPLSKKL